MASEVQTQDLVIATGNRGKAAEFDQLLGDLPYRVRLQADFNVVPAEETGLSFVENAILKARAAAEQTGLAALADDSGLEVDALDGQPGVHSARYALDENGERSDAANNARLLRELECVAESHRTARFHCVIVFLRHAADPVPFLAHGSWEGEILREPRGEGGFGYDPLFYVPEHQLSAAEMGSELKNSLSHRGQAVRSLLAHLRTATL